MDFGQSSNDSDIEAQPQRTKSSLSYECYNTAWICALHIELAAAQAMLDKIHEVLPRCGDDDNTYTLGSIKHHNIVISCPPQYGTNNAASLLTNLKRTFPFIQFGLIVGIGGGIPSKVDIRLGDVVVGTRVMQYDLEKVMPDGVIQRVATPRIPKSSLLAAVMDVRARHESQPSRVPAILRERMMHHTAYTRPKTPDRLFEALYTHDDLDLDCFNCDQSLLKQRKTRPHLDPIIHYGEVASGNRVVKDAVFRDYIARELGAICFEMEAAGLMDILPCLPIRGICDYSDSHKAKEWQRYAAGTAAAYARELLEGMPQEIGAKREFHRPSSSANQPVSSARRRILLKSLDFQQMDARKTDIKAAHSQTCQWLLAHPDYLSWLDQRQRHCRFLWIRGKPGVGKSIIMKFIYTRMRKQDQDRQVLTTSFFFNARGDDMEKSVSGMYRSLLLQLFEGFPDLQGVLDDQDLVPRNQTTCPSLNSLKDLFRAAILCLGNRSCACFIDALDECDEQQIRDMIEFFEELSEHCRGEGIKLRVCFSSRHYPYITIRSGILLTLEGQPGHNKDMESYIENQLRIENPVLFDSLKSTILDKAAGIFLWVALVVQILNADHRRGNPALQKRLKELPSGLSDLFKDLLTRDQDNMEELRLSIIWILFAQRPLEPEEYYHALWSDLSPEDLASLEMQNVQISNASGLFDRYVISSSKGLAETTQSKKPTVQFIHESVRDFLIKDKGLRDLWPGLGEDWESQSHDRLKSCCNTYILRHQAERPKCTSKSRKYIMKRYPLLEYASLFVLNHANAAADAIPQLKFLDDFHTPGWIHSFNTVERVSTRRYSQDMDILYILTDRGLSGLIRARLIDHPNINIEGGKFRYPLLAAIARRDKASILALLGVSSEIYDGTDITDDLDCKLETIQNNHTPLSWACEKGNLTLAKLLSRKGVHIDETSGESRRCLVGAMDNGHVEVVKWLIDQGASIETKDSLGHTLLYWSSARGDGDMSQKLLDRGAELDLNGTDQSLLLATAKGGREDTLQLLLNQGMEIESRDESGRTPLMLAVERGYAAMVQLLLKRGAEVEAMDYSYRTVLSCAFCGQADEVMLRLLLENGANTEVNDQDGKTFLCLAASQGNTAAVRLLLEHGANIESRDHYGMTALSHAVGEYGNEGIVRLLLEHGADVEVDSILGETPLMLAVKWGCVAVVQLLLQYGADVEARRHKIDSTPLVEAVKQGTTAVVQLLLENGAMVDGKDKYFDTPLSCAIENGDMVTVQLLLEKGACINTSNRDNKRPLFRAVYEGHEDIVRLLINRGAIVDLDGEQREEMEYTITTGAWRLPMRSDELSNGYPPGPQEHESEIREKELRLRRLLYPQSHGDVPGSTRQTS